MSHYDGDLIIREKYYGRSYEPLEDMISSISDDPGLRESVVAFIKLVPRRSLEGMNIALLVAGYMLHLKIAPFMRHDGRTGRDISWISDALEECYGVVRSRCEESDKAKVLRSIARYSLFVRQTLSTVW